MRFDPELVRGSIQREYDLIAARICENLYFGVNSQQGELVDVDESKHLGFLCTTLRKLVIDRTLAHAHGLCHTAFYQEGTVDAIRQKLMRGEVIGPLEYRK